MMCSILCSLHNGPDLVHSFMEIFFFFHIGPVKPIIQKYGKYIGYQIFLELVGTE